MDTFQEVLSKIPVLPIQFVYGAVAICGGVARYLNSFASGNGFSWRILVASAFVSGFSGWMFATLGTAIDMPQAVVYIMAGSGGFFGEQTMKLIMEFVKKRALE